MQGAHSPAAVFLVCSAGLRAARGCSVLTGPEDVAAPCSKCNGDVAGEGSALAFFFLLFFSLPVPVLLSYSLREAEEFPEGREMRRALSVGLKLPGLNEVGPWPGGRFCGKQKVLRVGHHGKGRKLPSVTFGWGLFSPPSFGFSDQHLRGCLPPQGLRG